ncbi:MAG: hypothetical protein HYY18_17345 [Planctomycetes bacterium]|nr:hypothetical protein [Planctomycetota bacterium]
MKTLIKIAAVIAIAVVLHPWISRAKQAWTDGKARAQQEQVRAQETVEDVKTVADDSTKAAEELNRAGEEGKKEVERRANTRIF